MEIGTVRTFPITNLLEPVDQALKIMEEAAEVFAEAQKLEKNNYKGDFGKLVMECSDVIMATCNMLHLVGCDNITHIMRACEKRNEDRGRYDVQE